MQMKEISKRVLLKKMFAYLIQLEEKYFRKLNGRYSISEYFEGALIEYRHVYVCLLCGTSFYADYSRYPSPMNFDGFMEHIREEHKEWELANWLYHERVKYVCRNKTKPYPLKPWHDPESLYCDREFLEKLLSKEIAEGNECKG